MKITPAKVKLYVLVTALILISLTACSNSANSPASIMEPSLAARASEQELPADSSPQYNAPQDDTIQGDTLQNDATQSNMPQGDTSQDDATQSNMPQGDAPQNNAAQSNIPQGDAPQNNAALNSVLQDSAICSAYYKIVKDYKEIVYHSPYDEPILSSSLVNQPFIPEDEEMGGYCSMDEPVELHLEGGSLLDFNNDGVAELALLYKDDVYYTEVCVVWSFRDGRAFDWFSVVLYNGGNWGSCQIVENEGRGAICEEYFLMPEGSGVHALGGGPSIYKIVEDGELVQKFGYYLNNYIDSWVIYYQVWNISRYGNIVDSGTAEPDAVIPQIEAAKAEAEATFGTEWTPLSVEELLRLLHLGI